MSSQPPSKNEIHAIIDEITEQYWNTMRLLATFSTPPHSLAPTAAEEDTETKQTIENWVNNGVKPTLATPELTKNLLGKERQ
ncbi:hypothetical protein [Bifidobacterium oedipodis]|uniref:Uncharacterized protein n=1 Tax=Bifidobacterium oedipodis TaxID=2675322 RepID=A0A7Y0EPE8_9BIFI|nr:hypothetical protein [Bifidobacterium sp. DSM 109957]NMM93907.1 hypothetical protein [Bifidobacterium sp. DSM 109957]